MFQGNSHPSFCWLILLMTGRPCGGSGRRSFSRSRKSQRDGPEKAFTGSFSLRQILHAEKVSGDVATWRLTRFCMSEAISRRLSRPSQTARRSHDPVVLFHESRIIAIADKFRSTQFSPASGRTSRVCSLLLGRPCSRSRQHHASEDGQPELPPAISIRLHHGRSRQHPGSEFQVVQVFPAEILDEARIQSFA
jgi:hypothetical protein